MALSNLKSSLHGYIIVLVEVSGGAHVEIGGSEVCRVHQLAEKYAYLFTSLGSKNDICVLDHSLIKSWRHRWATHIWKAWIVTILLWHVIIEGLNIQLIQARFLQIFRDKGMLTELLDWYSVVLVHLETLHEEEASLNLDCFTLCRQLVATIVNLGYQVFHLKTMEWRHSDHHFIEHDSQCPSVHFHTVTTLFQQLGARIERCAADAEVCIGAIKDRR